MKIEKYEGYEWFYYRYRDSKTGNWIYHGLFNGYYIGYYYHRVRKGFSLRNIYYED